MTPPARAWHSPSSPLMLWRCAPSAVERASTSELSDGVRGCVKGCCGVALGAGRRSLPDASGVHDAPALLDIWPNLSLLSYTSRSQVNTDKKKGSTRKDFKLNELIEASAARLCGWQMQLR